MITREVATRISGARCEVHCRGRKTGMRLENEIGLAREPEPGVLKVRENGSTSAALKRKADRSDGMRNLVEMWRTFVVRR